MKITTFNCNSIRARIPALSQWLACNNPDILCFQETKVMDKDFPADFFESAGYPHMAVRGQKSYNGVAVVSRIPLDDISRDLYNEGDEQARFISVSVSGLRLINVYVPQGFAVGSEKFDYKLKWMEDLVAFVKESYTPQMPLIITGDFNITADERDIYDPDAFEGEVSCTDKERKLLSSLISWGLTDLFRLHEKNGGHFTFWDYRVPNALQRNVGWRIDYILATEPVSSNCKKVHIDKESRLLPKPSDHAFVTAEIDWDKN